MASHHNNARRLVKQDTSVQGLTSGEPLVCRMESLEPRLLLSGLGTVDAGVDQASLEGQVVQFAGTFVADGGGGGGARAITQVTNDTFDDKQLSISRAGILWVGGANADVFFYDGQTTQQLTSTAGSEFNPQMDGNYIVWQGSGGIFLYDRAAAGPAVKISGASGASPCISGNTVVYTETPGSYARVVAYDITTGTSQVLYNTGGWQSDPRVSGNKVVWVGPGPGGVNDIFLHNLTTHTTINLSNNTRDDLSPKISGDNVVWVGYDGADYEIYFYDGQAVTQLVDGTVGDYAPRIWGNRVAWSGEVAGAGREVFYYDNDTKVVQRITHNNVLDNVNDIAGDYITWVAQGSYLNRYDVWVYDIAAAAAGRTSTFMVNLENTYDDFDPVVSVDGTIAWRGQVGGQYQDFEIFHAGFQYRFAWDFGDGTGATGTLTPTHTYADNGAYVATLTVSDSQSNFVSDAMTVSVANVAPAVSIIGAPAAGNEGTPIALTSTVTDPGIHDTLTYAWTVTKNGEAVAYGTDAAFTFTPDDNGAYVALLVVTDKDGGEGSALASTDVLNVAPTVNIDGPATSSEGAAVTLASTVTDPGVLDTFWRLWTVTKNGNPFATGTDADFTFTPDDNGTYVASLAVVDKDGDVGSASASVDVLNIAPTASIAGPATSSEGAAVTLTSTVTDPGVPDTFSYLWTVTKDGNPFATGTDADFTFTPDDNGAFTATLTVTDKDGGQGNASAAVDVLNVAPTVTAIAGPGVGVRGQALSFAASYTDPGTLDTQTVAWQVVDAGGAVVASGTGTTIAFTPANLGTYQVNVLVTDKDGGAGSGSAAVRVDAAGILADPVDGAPALMVGGSTGADAISVKRGSQVGTVAVWVGGQLVGEFGEQSMARIVIYGGAGDDDIKIAPNVLPISVELYGGAGDDKLAGGPGNDIIVGGEGDDLLWGDDGNDLLIGGTGTDKLMGGKGDDVLVGGSFSGENNREALRAIMDEWSRTDISYILKSLHLTYGGGLNGDWLLDETTITDDNLRDKVFGEQGLDYFLVGIEDQSDWRIYELLTVVEANFIFTI